MAEAVMDSNETLVRVHSEWNGWKTAEVRMSDLADLHWFQPNGAPHALLHGFILCTQMVSGAVTHDCHRPSAPHRLLICVLKRHAIPTIYAELARRAHAERLTISRGA
jgi:hypothetical protein